LRACSAGGRLPRLPPTGRIACVGTPNASKNPMNAQFASFREFYPFYLSEHSDRNCRRLHFVGSTLVLIVFAVACSTQRWMLLWLLPLLGYGFAWAGHFFFEHNRPATFKHPLYSFAGDWVMYWQLLTRRVPF
jgi:hypothetical protein